MCWGGVLLLLLPGWLAVQVNPAEELLARATRCRLSGERLAPPCVADELGEQAGSHNSLVPFIHR
jgi:hypothetical protein